MQDDDDDEYSKDGSLDGPPRNGNIEVTELTGMMSLGRQRMRMPSSGDESHSETISGKNPTSDVEMCKSADVVGAYEPIHVPIANYKNLIEESKSSSDGTAKTDSNSNLRDSDQVCAIVEVPFSDNLLATKVSVGIHSPNFRCRLVR
jgi:hypothetical protein